MFWFLAASNSVNDNVAPEKYVSFSLVFNIKYEIIVYRSRILSSHCFDSCMSKPTITNCVPISEFEFYIIIILLWGPKQLQTHIAHLSN